MHRRPFHALAASDHFRQWALTRIRRHSTHYVSIRVERLCSHGGINHRP